MSALIYLNTPRPRWTRCSQKPPPTCVGRALGLIWSFPHFLWPEPKHRWLPRYPNHSFWPGRRHLKTAPCCSSVCCWPITYGLVSSFDISGFHRNDNAFASVLAQVFVWIINYKGNGGGWVRIQKKLFFLFAKTDSSQYQRQFHHRQ